MREKRKICFCFVMAAAVVYAALVLVLYCSEAGNDSSSIRTLGDAVWYSLVTLTTVGYGDFVPVTPLGHAVGIVFLFLATGIMVTLLGAAASFFASEVMPLFLLRLQRKKNWYYFADCGRESNVLAADIYRNDPDAVIIFGEKRGAQSEAPDCPCFFLNAPLSHVAAQKKGVAASAGSS